MKCFQLLGSDFLDFFCIWVRCRLRYLWHNKTKSLSVSAFQFPTHDKQQTEKKKQKQRNKYQKQNDKESETNRSSIKKWLQVYITFAKSAKEEHLQKIVANRRYIFCGKVSCKIANVVLV